MANNLVFNNVASQLKTQIYGDGGAIKTDIDGKLFVHTVDTVSTVNEVLNVQSVDVVDTVSTISEVLNVQSVDVVDTVSIVSEVLNVQSVDVVDTVATVATVNYVNEVKSITDTVNVNVVNNGFIEDVATTAILADGSTAIVIMENTSEEDVYSFFVRQSDGTGSAEVWLQIAPVDDDAFYVNDETGTVTITAGAPAVLVAQKYLKYTRVMARATGGTAQVEAHYNARN